MNPFYLVVALGTGAAIAVQALANSRLRVALGTPVWAAIAQFIVGLAALAAIALLTRRKWLEWGMFGVAGVGVVIGALAAMHI